MRFKKVDLIARSNEKYYLNNDTRGVQFIYVDGTQVALLCTSEALPPYFLEIVTVF